MWRILTSIFMENVKTIQSPHYSWQNITVRKNVTIILPRFLTCFVFVRNGPINTSRQKCQESWQKNVIFSRIVIFVRDTDFWIILIFSIKIDVGIADHEKKNVFWKLDISEINYVSHRDFFCVHWEWPQNNASRCSTASTQTWERANCSACVVVAADKKKQTHNVGIQRHGRRLRLRDRTSETKRTNKSLTRSRI